MKNISNSKKNTQLLEIAKQIFYFKKKSLTENITLSKDEMILSLSNTCIKQQKFIFCKNDIKYLLNSSDSQIDYIINKYELNLSKNKHKKLIILQKFLTYFAIPEIINYSKNKKQINTTK